MVDGERYMECEREREIVNESRMDSLWESKVGDSERVFIELHCYKYSVSCSVTMCSDSRLSEVIQIQAYLAMLTLIQFSFI